MMGRRGASDGSAALLRCRTVVVIVGSAWEKKDTHTTFLVTDLLIRLLFTSSKVSNRATVIGVGVLSSKKATCTMMARRGAPFLAIDLLNRTVITSSKVGKRDDIVHF
jgi:hypothetical protein